MKFLIVLFFFIFLYSCGGVEFTLKEKDLLKNYKNNTQIVLKGDKKDIYARKIFSFFGDNINGKFILEADFSERKENRLVKKNQVAEKIDYEIIISYTIYNKELKCKTHEKKITSKFSFVPKSFGYNFGSDRSLEKLYDRSIKNNIQRFSDSIPEENICIK